MKKQSKNIILWMLAIITVLLLINQYGIFKLNSKLDFAGSAIPVTKAKERKIVQGDATDVVVDFYVMSYCPYGNQAEEGLEPVYQALKDSVTFRPRFVWYSNYRGGGPDFCIDDNSVYCSMHGVQEGNQDIRESCTYKYLGADAFFEFALAMNKRCSSGNADTCWEGVAESLGLDTNTIKQCEAEEAIELAAEDKEKGDALGVRGSPSIFINGKSYSGARTPEGYRQAICSEFSTPPEECEGTVLSTVNTAPVTGGCG